LRIAAVDANPHELDAPQTNTLRSQRVFDLYIMGNYAILFGITDLLDRITTRPAVSMPP